ncbi:chorismate-binding protein [Alkalicoccobacillus plakortidis]|uniref:Chorismate-binding protein n=1 Tax=Alkalicoccobacillus plakortidis TaxID=444060 RepID=A0ABT0XN95_9BACI|nr:chorismate-binding protein [Alkalicoccobacillus plakortidis]MCM2677366.1 chorismate-binding protein [Alkalicoccobacillus plakortidis]
MFSSLNTEKKESLLESYDSRNHPFFYKSSEGTIRSEGVGLMVDAVPMNDREFSTRLALAFDTASKQGIKDPVIVGAIPFNREQKPFLHIPLKVQKESGVNCGEPSELAAISGEIEWEEIPKRNMYEQMVEKGVAEINKGAIEKIVLGRRLQLITNGTVDRTKILTNLASVNQAGFTFAVDLEGRHSEQTTLMGASPELLVRKKGNQLSINPLAGSRPRTSDPKQDVRLAEELMSSEKDLHEHAFVVDAIIDQLRPICKDIKVPDQPSVIATKTMWHLSTYITAVPKNEYQSASALAKILHPTQAVCGFSRDQAAAKIKEIEQEDRAFFTGLVGLENAAGDGEWAIAIRCAEVSTEQVELFAWSRYRCKLGS